MEPRFQRWIGVEAIILVNTTRPKGPSSSTQEMVLMRTIIVAGLAILLAASTAQAQSASKPDTAFDAMQRRGKSAMGVDQYTSSHHFDALPDGGRIELVRDTDDSAGVAQIRRHLREIADAFSRGDFSTPAFVHMQSV